MRLRDAAALPPLLDTPMSKTDVGGHLGSGVPPAEQFIKGLCHTSLLPLDRLSSQGRTTHPVTPDAPGRTIRPMGKATTPTRFKQNFCAKLKAAREFRGITQEDMAKRLDILPNTYSKYEKRSLMPHYLLVQASIILDVTPDYFYGFEALAKASSQ
jgi:DNA-binding XRE family transcriptional regulator